MGAGASWAVVYFWRDGAALELAAFGALLAIVSQLGDLFESAIKRRFDVKDSGAIIPGHGGVFDRVDGLMAAAVVLVLINIAFGENVVTWLS